MRLQTLSLASYNAAKQTMIMLAVYLLELCFANRFINPNAKKTKCILFEKYVLSPLLLRGAYGAILNN